VEVLSTDSLEKRIFSIVVLLAAIMGFLAGLINIFSGNPMREIFLCLALLLVGVVFYTASVRFDRDKYLRIPLILIILAIAGVAWITNQGSQGDVPFFVFLLFALCLIIFRSPYNFILLVVYSATLMGLLLLEYIIPSAIDPYSSEQHRALDVALNLFICLAISTTLSYLVVQEYKKERILNDILHKQTLKDKSALEQAMADIKLLEGILSVCSFCKKIRDDNNEWNKMETYISKHSGVEFSHGLCPDCGKEHYPDYLK
jgi:hypothetical protein